MGRDYAPKKKCRYCNKTTTRKVKEGKEIDFKMGETTEKRNLCYLACSGCGKLEYDGVMAYGVLHKESGLIHPFNIG